MLDGPYEAKKVIRQAVKDLEREGVVYFKDSSSDLYEVCKTFSSWKSALLIVGWRFCYFLNIMHPNLVLSLFWSHFFHINRSLVTTITLDQQS